MQATTPLPLPRVLAYGLPGLPLAMLGLPLYVFLPAFYADSMGLGLAAVGLALMLARVWDVLLDPLIGFAADWIPGAHRRKTLMLLGLPPFIFALYFLLSPAPGSGIGTLYWAAFLGFAGWSLVTLPYQSFGAEADPTPPGRTRLASAREGMGLVGVLLASALPVLFDNDPEKVLQAVFYAVAIGLPVSLLLLIGLVPERPSARRPLPFSEIWPLLRHNHSLRRLLSALFFNNLANGIPAVLFVLYVNHHLQAPNALGGLLLLYFGVGILALPAWVWLARRIGSRRAWGISIGLAGLSFAVVPLLGAGQIGAFATICAISGLSLGADLALPAALQGDLAAADAAQNHTDRTGLFFGLFGLISKLALAAATGLAFGLLSVSGYASDTNVAPLAWSYGGLPVALKLVAAWLVWQHAYLPCSIDSSNPLPFAHSSPTGEPRHAAPPRPPAP